MSNLIVIVLIMLYSFQSGFCNMFAAHYPGNKRYSSQIFSVCYGLIVSLVTIVFAGFSFESSALTVSLGLLNGAVLVLYNAMLIKASEHGPFSVVMIFNLSGGILMPMAWSIIVDGTRLSLAQYAAIAVMLVSFFFLNAEDGGKRTLSVKFFLYSLALSFANGSYATLLNLQKTRADASESAEMIILTFGSSAVFALALLLLRAGKDALPGFRQNAKSAVFLTAASVSAAAAVNTLMYALNFINVAVLTTMDNGGVLLVSVLWSVIFLHEKLCKKKIVGLVMALAAILALGFFQAV